MSRVIEAVVFDLDGLLVDSEPIQIAAWRQFLSAYDRVLDDQLLSEMFGLRVRDSSRLVAERLNLPLAPSEIMAGRDQVFFELLHGNVRPMPGAIELIAQLNELGVKLGLATSGHRRYVSIVLKELSLDRTFQAEVTSDDIERGKPAPDIYLEAARKLGVEPARCVALEDAPLGIASAIAAGMYCLAVPNEQTQSLPGLERATAAVASLHDALPWLKARQLVTGR
ncbi:MAG TPA: HAD family phosphatase [Thermomicrobiaceae bacterium]|nr:HAD family phosphatase [Thermomicrobiaceae bacterium]